jgi:hypothetical protein
LDLDAEPRLPTAEERREAELAAAGQAPAEPTELDLSPYEKPVPAFRSPRVRGQVLQLWLVGGIFVDLALAVLSVIHLGLLDDRWFLDPKQAEKIAASDDRIVLVYIALIVVFLITSLFFLAWFHRAYKNLRALGCEHPRWGTGWSIGAWFIPIASFFIPKQITDDIWRCSVGRQTQPELPWRVRRVPGWVHFWWFLFIVGTLAGNGSGSFDADGSDVAAERMATLVDVITAPIYVVGAILTWRLVDRVSKAQEEAAPATEPPPPRP